MRKVLLDTYILSEVMKAKDDVVVDNARRYLAHWRRLTFSAVSVMEVVAGYSRRGSEEKLKKFVSMTSRSEVLPLDPVAGELAGRIYADLQRAGLNIGVPDTMIAAIALHHALPLVTGNASDHARIQEAGYPLMLETWRAITDR
jgi:tRNA(fMet)-specific endonuclease VapC